MLVLVLAVLIVAALAAALACGLRWELKEGRSGPWLKPLRVDRQTTPAAFWLYIAVRGISLLFLLYMAGALAFAAFFG